MVLIIIEQSLLYLPFVIGAYISISLMKIPDLSIESAYTFGAILASNYVLLGYDVHVGISLFFIMLIALAGGLIVGGVSSSLTQVAGIPHLLSSILTGGLFHGVNQAVLGTSMKSLAHQQNVLTHLPGIVTHPELLTLVIIGTVVVFIAFVFLKTQLGFCLVVYGNNPAFFEHHKISGRFIFFVGVLVANGLAGLSGFLVVQTSSFVDTTMGLGIALFAITALVLGKAIVYTNKPKTVLVPLVGVIGYFVLQQLLLKVGFNLKYFTMIQAIIVLMVLVFTFRKKQGKQSFDTLGV